MTLPSVADLTVELMLIPGLAGYETRVATAIKTHLETLGPIARTGWAICPAPCPATLRCPR